MSKKDPTAAIANAILQVSNLLGAVSDQIIKDPFETKGRKTLAKMSKTVAKSCKKIAVKAKTPAKPKHLPKSHVAAHSSRMLQIPADSPIAQILMRLIHG